MIYNYDLLYGVNIKEYVKRHNTKIDNIIKKTEIDIAILKENLLKITRGNLKHLPEKYPLIEKEIYDLIDKKKKHLERLKEWR